MTENKTKQMLSCTQKLFKREKKLFIFLFVILLLILIIPRISSGYLLEIPKPGGSMAEIHIGQPPRFINPVLANTDSDRDLLPLIYSSVLRRDSEGNIIPSAGSVALSDDKKVYTITLDQDILFSDGKYLTADDVLFTIKKIQDPFIRSPYDVQWLNAEVEKIDDHTLTITLQDEYAQFTNTLAGLYILPKHLWFDIPPSEFPFSNLNRKPIGSGPYVVNNTLTDNNAKIIKYNLSRNENYFADDVFIENVSLYYFDTYDDYKKSLIFSDRKITKNIFSVSSELLNDVSSEESFLNSKTMDIPSGRNFALFINPKNNTLLATEELREAISLAIDTDRIINTTLSGHAENIAATNETTLVENIAEAKKLLAKNFTLTDESGKNVLLTNKTKTPVQIQLSILESSEFKNIAEVVKQNLSELGIDTEVTSYGEHDLVDTVVRGRDFETLLFGYQTDVVDPDLYYFFHSSQTVDPGINIANFADKSADKLILELRKNISETDRAEKSEKLQELIISDFTYIPLYSPNYIYIMDSRIHNAFVEKLNARNDRFQNIASWYNQTEKILPIFNSQQ